MAWHTPSLSINENSSLLYNNISNSNVLTNSLQFNSCSLHCQLHILITTSNEDSSTNGNSSCQSKTFATNMCHKANG